jgi:hypothetical protein
MCLEGRLHARLGVTNFELKPAAPDALAANT